MVVPSSVLSDDVAHLAYGVIDVVSAVVDGEVDLLMFLIGVNVCV